jgi:hypothetical protein
MATVSELRPGDLVLNGGMEAVYIEHAPHPLFPGLRLVIWRLGDEWSFDAQDPRQDVGEVWLPSDVDARMERLRGAGLGKGGSDHG